MEEGFPLAVEIPRGMFGREQQIISYLKAAKERGITHTLAQNIGAIPLAKELGFAVHGGFGLNIMNSLSAEQMRLCGLSDVETSFELTEKKTNALAGEIPRGFLAYGRLPLMLTRNCPVKTGRLIAPPVNTASTLPTGSAKNFQCSAIIIVRRF